jgi:hypothetical protein
MAKKPLDIMALMAKELKVEGFVTPGFAKRKKRPRRKK